MDANEIQVGLIGCGTVGSGVAKILLDDPDTLEKRANRRLKLTGIAVRSPAKQRFEDVPEELFTQDAKSLTEDNRIGIIVEVIGGVEPARELITNALQYGKHVVTANKEVVAKHGQEFLELARQNRVNFYYEAAVCGGIPIIHALKNSLSANRIHKVVGIMNGTTNFILSKMYEQQEAFDKMLEKAQELGYAESDPSDDVDGYDVAYKLAILSSIAFNSHFPYEKIHFEGIRGISEREIEIARKLGYVIKLLAIGHEHEDQSVELRVHPVMLDEWHPLAGVNGCHNAVYVEGNYVGDTMFYGPGAGGLPTASAIVGDVMDIAMQRDTSQTHPSVLTNFSEKKVVNMGEVVSEYYFRLQVADQPGVLAAIANACGDKGVSLKFVEQRQTDQPNADEDAPDAELILITHTVCEDAMQSALSVIKTLDCVHQVYALLRVGL